LRVEEIFNPVDLAKGVREGQLAGPHAFVLRQQIDSRTQKILGCAHFENATVIRLYPQRALPDQ
jgi:hypothetical protein